MDKLVKFKNGVIFKNCARFRDTREGFQKAVCGLRPIPHTSIYLDPFGAFYVALNRIERDVKTHNEIYCYCIHAIDNESGYINGFKTIHIGKRIYYLHRAIAQTYIPNPDNKKRVYHKDGNKHNNYISNLEWR